MDERYYLYWIHRPCQTNMELEGYIGITFNTEKRFYSHKKSAKLLNKYIIHHAINKYDDLIYTTICIGYKEYIVNLEYLLRPKQNIGWNMSVGGDDPRRGIKRAEDSVIKTAMSNVSVDRFTVIQMMIDRYIRGMDFKDIGNKYGVSKDVVSYHTHRKGITYPEIDSIYSRIIACQNRSEVTEEVYNSILTAKDSGLSYEDVAKLFNMGLTHTYNMCTGGLKYTYKFKSYRICVSTDMEISFKGETHSLKEWATITGIPYRVITYRKLNGFSTEHILSEDRVPAKATKLITYKGVTNTVAGWAKVFSINRRVLVSRICRGWSIDDAFNKKVRKRSCKAI